MSDIRVDEQLNLVLPVKRPDGKTYHIHSTPISAQIFADHYEPIARVFNKLYAGGIGMLAGPRVSFHILRDLCTKNETWDGPNGVENTLCSEIWRLTNVLIPGTNGWDLIPFQDVMRKNIFTPRELDEVQNILIFFTVNFSMHKAEVMRFVMQTSQGTWDARVTPLNFMGFKNSLVTPIEEGNTGETAKA